MIVNGRIEKVTPTIEGHRILLPTKLGAVFYADRNVLISKDQKQTRVMLGTTNSRR